MRRRSTGGLTVHAAFEAGNAVDSVDVDNQQKMVVAVRIRPLSTSEKGANITHDYPLLLAIIHDYLRLSTHLCPECGQTSCVSVINNSVVAIKKGSSNGAYLKSQSGSLNEYQFDCAFDEESTQYQVYEKTAKIFIPNVLAGFNVTVFAYGATGAGKTHTMLGNTRADEAASNAEAGIIPNAVTDLFNQIDKKKSTGLEIGEEWSVNVTFVEVYNEQVYDLLETSGKILYVREDQKEGIVAVAGVTERKVAAISDVMELLSEGNKNRKTESTMANQVSSRSHAVLQILVKHTKRNYSGREIITDSKLSLIDLAGSERASSTNNRGARLQEGANINKSLLALANCINALAGNHGIKKNNVNYRDSKLTHLLKPSLEGNCHLVMICNINPSHLTFEDSHNTLKYANRAKNIKVCPTMKENTKESSWMDREIKLREENALLKARIEELEMFILSTHGSLPASSLPLLVSSANTQCNDNVPTSSAKKRSRAFDEECPMTNEVIVVNVDVKEAANISMEAKDSVNLLSDSVLEAGLFGVNEDMEEDLPMLFVEEKVKPTPVSSSSDSIAPQANKKRRASFIPMASSKARTDTKASTINVVPTTIAQSTVVIPSVKQGNETKKSSGKSRLSMGKESKSIPVSGQENENPQILPISSSSTVTKVGTTTRRKSLSNVQSVLDNINVTTASLDPKQNTTMGSLFDGFVKRVTRRSQQVVAGNSESVPVATNSNGGQYWGDI